MLFDCIGRTEAADTAHLSASSVAMQGENLSESPNEGAVAVRESKLAPLWGGKNQPSHHCDLTHL